jgi:hypothetical protein
MELRYYPYNSKAIINPVSNRQWTSICFGLVRNDRQHPFLKKIGTSSMVLLFANIISELMIAFYPELGFLSFASAAAMPSLISSFTAIP